MWYESDKQFPELHLSAGRDPDFFSLQDTSVLAGPVPVVSRKNVPKGKLMRKKKKINRGQNLEYMMV